jgi:hypothetical protein
MPAIQRLMGCLVFAPPVAAPPGQAQALGQTQVLGQALGPTAAVRLRASEARWVRLCP